MWRPTILDQLRLAAWMRRMARLRGDTHESLGRLLEKTRPSVTLLLQGVRKATPKELGVLFDWWSVRDKTIIEIFRGDQSKDILGV